MDARHFLEVDLRDPNDQQVRELQRFSKATFQLESVLDTASDLKYKGEIKKVLAREVLEPQKRSRDITLSVRS